MVKIEDPKLNGAELIRELKKTGTSDGKLEFASQLLGFIHRKEKRVARADELIDAMEKQGLMPGYDHWPITPPLTLQKAYALARTGKWEGPTEAKEPTIEDMILAGETLADMGEVKSPIESMVESPAPTPADTKADTIMGLKPVVRTVKKIVPV